MNAEFAPLLVVALAVTATVARITYRVVYAAWNAPRK
jgi:hypothetical protein